MAKDSLARGAKSAQFSGGRAKTNDPIEFHGTVAAEELPPGISPSVEDVAFHEPSNRPNGVYLCEVCGTSSFPCRHVGYAQEKAQAKIKHVVALASVAPMNDRVLLREVIERDTKLIIEPDAFASKACIGEVVAVGDGMIIGGALRPIALEVGQRVMYGEYGAEIIKIDGEKLLLVSAFDVRLKFAK